MSDYEFLPALFRGDGLGDQKFKPKGPSGSRQWSFYESSVDRDIVDDVQSLIDHVEAETGLVAEALLFNVESGDGDDQADTHTMVVGHLDEDPGKTWAIKIRAVLPHVEDFDTAAEILVLENRADIEILIGADRANAFRDLARDISLLVNLITQGDPDLVEQAFAHIRADEENGQWLRQWEAIRLGQSLDQATAPATGKKPASRM